MKYSSLYWHVKYCSPAFISDFRDVPGPMDTQMDSINGSCADRERRLAPHSAFAGIFIQCSPNDLMPSASLQPRCFSLRLLCPLSAVGETHFSSCIASTLSSPAFLRFVEIVTISIEDPEQSEGRADYEVVISHEHGAVESGSRQTSRAEPAWL